MVLTFTALKKQILSEHNAINSGHNAEGKTGKTHKKKDKKENSRINNRVGISRESIKQYLSKGINSLQHEQNDSRFDQHNQSSTLNHRKEIPLNMLNAGLLETKFCYGCDQFSVDYPDTQNEMAWCVRQVIDDNGQICGGYYMVRIFKKHKVKQCPKIKEAKRKSAA